MLGAYIIYIVYLHDMIRHSITRLPMAPFYTKCVNLAICIYHYSWRSTRHQTTPRSEFCWNLNEHSAKRIWAFLPKLSLFTFQVDGISNDYMPWWLRALIYRTVPLGDYAHTTGMQRSSKAINMSYCNLVITFNDSFGCCLGHHTHSVIMTLKLFHFFMEMKLK